jgi:MoxR-like ATPase
MPYPYFGRGLDKPSAPAQDIPTLERGPIDDPAGYRPHPDLAHAVNVALLLGMPLLVTGDPGTGKTQLAFAVGQELGSPVFKFETKSTSMAKDLFYQYDALGAFKTRDDADPRTFITYQALGLAILEAFEASQPRVAALLPQGYVHRGPRRSVVLIDEIDKAPRDFPNDLLNEIERFYFRVPELRNIGSPGAESGESGVPARQRPIVIITSNSEKGLPDPFLRRCVYFDIPFPTAKELDDIVAARVAGLSGGALLADAIALFETLRGSDRTIALKKKPSTAELLNWLQVLVFRGAKPSEPLRDAGRKPLVQETLSTLIKSSDDRKVAQDYVETRWLA